MKIPAGYTVADFERCSYDAMSIIEDLHLASPEGFDESAAIVVSRFRKMEACLFAFEPLIVAADGHASDVAEFKCSYSDDHEMHHVQCTAHGVATVILFNVAGGLLGAGELEIEEQVDAWVEKNQKKIGSVFSGFTANRENIAIFTCRMEREHWIVLDYLDVSTSSEFVTKREVAEIINMGAKSLDRYSSHWGKPAIRGRGQKPFRWKYEAILPVLREQFPDKDLPDTRPET